MSADRAAVDQLIGRRNHFWAPFGAGLDPRIGRRSYFWAPFGAGGPMNVR